MLDARCSMLDAGYSEQVMNSNSKVRCPTCRKEGDWFAGDYRPFCSRRCRLIDLGKWLNEEHNVSEPLRGEHLETGSELPAEEGPDKTEDGDRSLT
jgi:endogenous inhibitor of DNA gyrase (YacG/DUF329 family)